jgi:flagellar operon protein
MNQPIDYRLVRPPGVGTVTGIGTTQPQGTPRPQGGGGFADALAKAEGKRDVTFSAHAAERLSRRGIQISEGDRQKLNEAVAAVEAKGGRNSLVMLGSTALIVNVPSRTVVTAMGAGMTNERVITNIDSAVIA